MIRCGKKSNGDLWFQFMFCALILQPHEPFVRAIRMFDLLFNSATCSCHSHYQQHSFHFSNPIHSHNLLEAKDSIGSCKLRWVAQTSSLFPPSWNHHGTHRGGNRSAIDLYAFFMSSMVALFGLKLSTLYKLSSTPWRSFKQQTA